jgi:mono/diheme cytochrome c family protein
MKATARLALACLVSVAVVQVAAADPATKDLRGFYQVNCAGCHGADGAARGPDGKSLRGADFTAADFRKGTDDEAMAKVILKGKFFGLAMPAFKKDMTPEDAKRMVATVLRKCEKGKIIQPEAKPPASSP